MTSDEFLKHWGIPGMKWGRRKAKRPIKEHKDYSVSDKIRKKDIREMSNDELKTLTARLQLEKSYGEVSKKQASRGKIFVQNFIEQFAKQKLNNVLDSLLTKGISAAAAAVTNRNRNRFLRLN